MKFFGILTASVLAVGGLGYIYLSLPFQVLDDAGNCMFEVHPDLLDPENDRRVECGTTGELALAAPLNHRHYDR